MSEAGEAAREVSLEVAVLEVPTFSPLVTVPLLKSYTASVFICTTDEDLWLCYVTRSEGSGQSSAITRVSLESIATSSG